jgi:hypothetical protein
MASLPHMLSHQVLGYKMHGENLYENLYECYGSCHQPQCGASQLAREPDRERDRGVIHTLTT